MLLLLRQCLQRGPRLAWRLYSQDGSKKYSQPTPWTHKHLLKTDEVNVGITKTEFIQRRHKLVESLLRMRADRTGIFILPSARKQYMVDHIPYFFRQDTDFRYLTGCLQPDSILVIEFGKDGHKTILFMKDNTAYEERWEGTRFGFREAVEFFGVDEVQSINSFQEMLYRFKVDNPDLDLWYDLMHPREGEVHKTVLSFISSISERQQLQNIEPIRPALHRLRSVKSDAEIKLMRRTCQIGAEALKSTMSASRRLGTELDYLATVDYESRIRGAAHLAYPPVIAAGDNANTIHYIAATGQVEEGDMMLIDAGCEYHGYSSDITRTWPVAGRYTPAQQVLYEVVLRVQEQLIRSIIPGSTSIDQLYRSMQTLLAKGLQSAGLISQQHDEATATRFAHLFCPHNIGHHLGMDVHDCESVPKGQPLVPGNVITVEPGVYISANNTSVPEEFRGIGIRIEDDILINQSGCEILSKDCPKSIEEVQKLVLNENM